MLRLKTISFANLAQKSHSDIPSELKYWLGELDNSPHRALIHIGKIGHRYATDYVADYLKYAGRGTRFIRRAAANALRRIGDDQASDALLSVFSMKYDPLIKKFIFEDEDNNDSELIKAVLKAIKNLDTVQERTIAVIGQFLGLISDYDVFYRHEDHEGAPIMCTVKRQINDETAGGFHEGEKQSENSFAPEARKCLESLYERYLTEKTDRKVDLNTLPDPRITEFSHFLKDHRLDSLIQIGGVARDIHTGIKSDDIDFTFRVPLNKSDWIDLLDARMLLPKHYFEKTMKELKAFAELLKVPVEKFLPPVAEKTVYWESSLGPIELQYCGPFKNEEGDFTKRALIDSKTGWVFVSNSVATMLRLGLANDGTLLGRTDALDDFDRGYVRLSNGETNLILGGILRTLRLKHQFRKNIVDQDWHAIKRSLRWYLQREDPNKISGWNKLVRKRLINKVLQKAINLEAARTELAELGIFRLVPQN